VVLFVDRQQLEQVEELIQSGLWKEAVLQAECAVLNGTEYQGDWAERLPEDILLTSPLLMLEEGRRLLHLGLLSRSKRMSSMAIKGFATQGFRTRMLAAMSLAGIIALRMGDIHSAETAFRFIERDLEDAGFEDIHGDVLHSLGVWKIMQLSGHKAFSYFTAAIQRYERDELVRGIRQTELDLILWRQLGLLSSNSEVSHRNILLWSNSNSHDYFYQCLQDLADGKPIALVERCPEDQLLRMLAGEAMPALKVLPASHKRLERGRVSQQAQRAAPLPSTRWQVRLFSVLTFSQGGHQSQTIHCRRKKAKELLIYLFLQPSYACPKERLLDVFWGEELPEKAANSLYVTVHELKRALSSQLGLDHGVHMKDGLVRLNEDGIEFVDVERYMALIRVADQLWLQDRELATDMYLEASHLYDELLPELPPHEWLEEHRSYLQERQVMLLRRLGRGAEDRQEWETAEAHYREWIRLRPYQEEGHQHLIRLFAATGRKQEAYRWYAKWEELCRKELGCSPSEETYQYVRE
jgi:DNA-binding SARP family transcriptional activator